MKEHDNMRKKECIHVSVTGSPCCTVGKKCIGEITIKKLKTKKNTSYRGTKRGAAG